MTITLQPVTRDNWHAVTKLAVAEGQENFVAPNVYSLAQAAYVPGMLPQAMYDGATLVGFVMYTITPDDGQFWIVRVLVDKQFQHQGYGRQAMVIMIDRMRQLPGCDAIYLDFHQDNTAARHLYESLGFVIVDKNDHEYIARLDLPTLSLES